MTLQIRTTITNTSFKKRHIISPSVSINDNFKNHCNSESDSSLNRFMCYSPSSRSLGSQHEKDVFDMSVFKTVTPSPSPIEFPTIAWCEDDEIGNSRIEVTPTSTSEENLIDDDDDDCNFNRSHRRVRYQFIPRSKSRKRSLCSLDGDDAAPLSPAPSISCGESCSGLWGHFILPSSNSITNQTDVSLSKSPSCGHLMNFKLHPRSHSSSSAKRPRSMSYSFP